ncbi:hypothetical protein NX801_16035 [Streptomyces sp. LP05-1]|uniref:Lipoprotein n=1 Tax=Streptomyces pyxinae TaxID=2970734 RepID=A0ABT2CIA1_9ACTN|nr:hypothetical protein [Streptomyces sp. LP05-1]MCS0637143.1 hypothetical protein [Streptomyces sp. LP05-1]
MRSTVIRRSALAAAAVSLAVLATACGSSDSGASGDKAADQGKGGDKAATAAPAAGGTGKALPAAELEKLVLAQGDLKGYTVQKSPEVDKMSAAGVTADKPACEPLAELVATASPGKPGATVKRQAAEDGSAKPKQPAAKDMAKMSDAEVQKAMAAMLSTTAVNVTLSSYEGNGAADAFAAVRTAATACAGGFTGAADKSPQKVSKVEKAEITGGDEAAAWTVTVDQEGSPMPMKVVAVRKGAVLASFTAINLASAANGKDFPMPTAVVDAQVKKLG